MNLKNLSILLLFSCVPTIQTGDDWDMIDDLDLILQAEDNRIEKALSSSDKTVAYKTVLKKAQTLSFNTKNITQYLDTLTNKQIKVVLNVWITRAVVSNAKGDLSIDTIKNVSQVAMNTYQGLRLIGDMPQKDKINFIGRSVPASLYFDFFDRDLAKKISQQPTGSFGEYYWNNSTLGSLKRTISESFQNALIDIIKKPLSKKR